MRPRNLCRLAAALGLWAAVAPPAGAQDELRLTGLVPVGGRTAVTDGAAAALRFTLDNFGPGRDARVVVFYPARPDVQFARDVWVPAQSRLTSWLPVGPPPDAATAGSREIAYQLFDRTGGGLRKVSRELDGRLPTRSVLYRRREPTTALLVDYTPARPGDPDPFDVPDSPAAEALALARAFRAARELSDPVGLIADRDLPAAAEAFDGVDQLLLASPRVANDPVAARAVRHWLLGGGTLWVPLDRVGPDALGAVLGGAVRFEVVDRTRAAVVRVRAPGEDPARAVPREFDRPVELVRVLPGGAESVHLEANGWPAAFSQPVGRGRVVFTALGGRGWHRPRVPTDPPPPPGRAPDYPIPAEEMKSLARVIYPEPQPDPLPAEALAPLLTADVGYQVLGRGAAAAVLAGFVLAVAAVGLVVQRSRSPERLGLYAPGVAALAAAAFLAAGLTSRRAVPPTAAAVAVAEVAPEAGEASARGLFAAYHPASGVRPLAAERGGEVDLNPAGLEGQPRRRVQTDFDAWHWEDAAFPAGLRAGPFRATLDARGVAVAARFGPGGLEGKLSTGPFARPDDALLVTRTGIALAVRLGPDGSFRAGPGDVLPPDQYLAGTVLTDRQQRRQEVYRKLLAARGPARGDGRDRLLVWAEPPDLPFAAAAERNVGSVLLAVPVEADRSEPGSAVVVPRGFSPFAAVSDGVSRRPSLEGRDATRMRWRFQLPPAAGVAPERAVFVARVRAPGRRFELAGFAADGRAVPVQAADGPTGELRIEIADARLLTPDAAGGVSLEVAVGKWSGDQASAADDAWRIEGAGLEVAGRAAKE